MLRKRCRKLKAALSRASGRLRLAMLRQRLLRQPPNTPGTGKYLGFNVEYNDARNFYVQIKDEQYQGIYRFESDRPDPLIIDGGSNNGLSILYFKHLYPHARIIGFEPDPAVHDILQRNLSRNRIDNVQLIRAGLGGHEGHASFHPDGAAGGQLTEDAQDAIRVPVVKLSTYLNEPIDFVKLNIEGQEHDVVAELAASGKLPLIRRMVIEYHGWPRGPQKLGGLLSTLEQHGFRYLVHDFDDQTSGASKPPFRLREQAAWFCLVYAENTGESAMRQAA